MGKDANGGRLAASEQLHQARKIRGRQPAGRPDTAVLYSVDDIALLARVSRVFVVRLCLAGELPGCMSVDGRRYWPRRDAIKAVSRCRKALRAQSPARRIA